MKIKPKPGFIFFPEHLFSLTNFECQDHEDISEENLKKCSLCNHVGWSKQVVIPSVSKYFLMQFFF